MDVMTVSFNAYGEYMGHTAIDDEPLTMLSPRTVYRVWHENGDFEGEFHDRHDAETTSALCECSHVQTVKIYPDGSEYDAT